jgi:DNA repair protein RecN (Recombination protein N)
MIIQLHIKNFTIIDLLDIEFSSGMTVLTGETGAGKSIIIDTLDLVLGARGDSSVIRAGCDRCEITAVFNLQNISAAQEWLTAQELEGDECIIRRTISADGRSRSSINGVPCLQQSVRELGSLLVNIHGQHEHQELMRRDKQCELLDRYAGHSDLQATVKKAFANWQAVNNELVELKNLVGKQDQLEFLNYQLQELNDLALGEGELEILHQEHKQLANHEQLVNSCNSALEFLEKNSLNNAQRELTSIQSYNSKFTEVGEMLQQAMVLTDEAIAELRGYLDRSELNPERLQQLDQRLQNIHNLARKHRVKPEELLEFQAKLTSQVQQLSGAADHVTSLEQKLKELSAKYYEVANELSASRQQAAEKLAQAITLELQRLNMQHAQISINFWPLKEQTKPSANGLEQIEFFIITNPGQPPQPLSKVVSGGELSRISLAIQLQTAQKDATPTLIFDEVDSGIGGKTAQIVGEMLRALGKQAQVICVTHLPQVAAQGNHHLQVSKQRSGATVSTQITALTGEERVAEIARMLGGVKISEQTLAHAREMCAIG